MLYLGGGGSECYHVANAGLHFTSPHFQIPTGGEEIRLFLVTVEVIVAVASERGQVYVSIRLNNPNIFDCTMTFN